MVTVFGEAGKGARRAVGVLVPPLGAAVEVDAIVAFHDRSASRASPAVFAETGATEQEVGGFGTDLTRLTSYSSRVALHQFAPSQWTFSYPRRLGGPLLIQASISAFPPSSDMMTEPVVKPLTLFEVF